MSNHERLKHRCRLAENKEHSLKLKLEIEDIRDSIRDNLDEFEPIEELELTHVVGQSVKVAALQIEYRKTLDTIKAIEKALG